MNKEKNISIFFIVILLATFVLAIFRILGWIYFWVVAIIVAIYAYKYLPKKNVRSRRR